MVAPGDECDVAMLCLDSLSHEQVRSVGCERLALAALDELRFIETLETLGASERDARIAAPLVVARMIHPSSEREAFRWLSSNSATLELFDVDSGKSLSGRSSGRSMTWCSAGVPALATSYTRTTSTKISGSWGSAGWKKSNQHPSSARRHLRSAQSAIGCTVS